MWLNEKRIQNFSQYTYVRSEYFGQLIYIIIRKPLGKMVATGETKRLIFFLFFLFFNIGRTKMDLRYVSGIISYHTENIGSIGTTNQ
jgi:hypothetical protein